jgi:Recombination endonuclease VII.
MRYCPDCKEIKSLGEFPRNRADSTGYASYCKPCHNARGREVKLRLHGGFREYHLRHRYGIGQKEFDALLASQGGVCAICGAQNPEHVDHDHVFGNVRGILCFNCNGGLGQFKDRPDLLHKAIGYLRGTSWQRILVQPGVYQLCSPRPASPRSPSF